MRIAKACLSCCFEDGVSSSCGEEVAKVMCVIILGGKKNRILLRAVRPACVS